ncbi:hypothetical protein NDU88_000624 [Pleurodeles waltl]|uniref:Uncharacterized protein n=1 Tax=Pleurodeles waltl TaxID=8319 RepID=A0AAV7U5R1_PLEWA|nr:hypothetical protein NDU88_000624 [Pleurodeles waltl]
MCHLRAPGLIHSRLVQPRERAVCMCNLRPRGSFTHGWCSWGQRAVCMCNLRAPGFIHSRLVQPGERAVCMCNLRASGVHSLMAGGARERELGACVTCGPQGSFTHGWCSQERELCAWVCCGPQSSLTHGWCSQERAVCMGNLRTPGIHSLMAGGTWE